MTEGQFDFDVRLTQTSEGTVVLPWPAALDEQQRHYVLSMLIAQLQEDDIWIQPEDVLDPHQCVLRAEGDTWLYNHVKVFAALSHALHTQLRTAQYDPSVMVGYVQSTI